MRIRTFCKYIALCALHIQAFECAAKIVTDSISHDKEETTLEETVVTAYKTDNNLSSSTPVFKIDESQILRKGITDISDAIHRLPGVTLRDYGGAGGLKTVSVRGLGAAHTAVIYDGLPLTDIQSGAIDISRYSVDNISSLQLVIGDNNDIFIPVRIGAAPASLSISTPEMKNGKTSSLTAKIKGGSFGYISPSFDFFHKAGINTTLGASAEFIHTDNNFPFRLINGNSYSCEKREFNKMNSGRAQLSAKSLFKSGGQLSGKIYYYDNDRELPGPVIYYNVNDGHETLRDRNFFLQSEYIRPFSEKWKLRIAGKFNWASTHYVDYSVIRDGKYKEENYYQREYYATGNLLFSPSQKWNFDYSADYSFNNLNSNLTPDARPRRNAFLQSLTAKYSSPRFNVLIRVIESLYFESAKSKLVAHKTFSRLSPSLSLSGKLLSEGLLYARISYKNIFRMPSFNEAYFNHFGSPDLKPETTDQINFGLTYQMPSIPILSFLSVTGDIYRNWVRDRIVIVPYNMFVWTITNLNSVHATGADVTLNSTLDLGKRQQLLVSGTWSYQRAKINVGSSESLYGKQVAYTPLNSGSFSICYENPWVNAVFHGQGTSARYAQNSNIPQSRLAGYFEFGATLWKSFRLCNHSLELRIDMMNMFDKQYVVIARYPMPGRSFMASIKFIL